MSLTTRSKRSQNRNNKGKGKKVPVEPKNLSDSDLASDPRLALAGPPSPSATVATTATHASPTSATTDIPDTSNAVDTTNLRCLSPEMARELGCRVCYTDAPCSSTASCVLDDQKRQPSGSIPIIPPVAQEEEEEEEEVECLSPIVSISTQDMIAKNFNGVEYVPSTDPAAIDINAYTQTLTQDNAPSGIEVLTQTIPVSTYPPTIDISAYVKATSQDHAPSSMEVHTQTNPVSAPSSPEMDMYDIELTAGQIDEVFKEEITSNPIPTSAVALSPPAVRAAATTAAQEILVEAQNTVSAVPSVHTIGSTSVPINAPKAPIRIYRDQYTQTPIPIGATYWKVPNTPPQFGATSWGQPLGPGLAARPGGLVQNRYFVNSMFCNNCHIRTPYKVTIHFPMNGRAYS